MISYGVDYPDLYRRSATYVDKILKGTKPADLPIEQPTKFELAINLKTAKVLGIAIPLTLLGRSRRGDRVARPDVALWHIADIDRCPLAGRHWGQSRHGKFVSTRTSFQHQPEARRQKSCARRHTHQQDRAQGCRARSYLQQCTASRITVPLWGSQCGPYLSYFCLRVA